MEDDEIVRLFLKRDERALTELQSKYARLCRSIAENILKNRTDAEDCVNDAYYKVWNSIPPYEPKSLRAFVARVAKNTALDIYDAYHTEKRGGGDSPLSLNELGDLVSGGSTVESSLENRELLAEINAFLSSLPGEKRRLFVNRYWYFYSTFELAEMYGMREHTVVVTLSRTRKALKEYLRKRGFEI
ncbi:MAG: sigma-70 family RNA polymerase sigma factor [Ruminococcaceae bacterium]|nr:sigma-70 family RNA polymerase sigma factor [Oscillospiraceae bacterium]